MAEDAPEGENPARDTRGWRATTTGRVDWNISLANDIRRQEYDDEIIINTKNRRFLVNPPQKPRKPPNFGGSGVPPGVRTPRGGVPEIIAPGIN